MREWLKIGRSRYMRNRFDGRRVEFASIGHRDRWFQARYCRTLAV